MDQLLKYQLEVGGSKEDLDKFKKFVATKIKVKHFNENPVGRWGGSLEYTFEAQTEFDIKEISKEFPNLAFDLEKHNSERKTTEIIIAKAGKSIKDEIPDQQSAQEMKRFVPTGKPLIFKFNDVYTDTAQIMACDASILDEKIDKDNLHIIKVKNSLYKAKLTIDYDSNERIIKITSGKIIVGDPAKIANVKYLEMGFDYFDFSMTDGNKRLISFLSQLDSGKLESSPNVIITQLDADGSYRCNLKLTPVKEKIEK